MEALNRATHNTVSVHPTNNCVMSVKRLMQGAANNTNCTTTANYNEGSDVSASSSSLGPSFNAGGGATMALEWRNEGIRVWQFARGQVPADMVAGSPDPSTWSQALADFPSTECDISSHFRNASITANIDLCGDAMNGGQYEASQCTCSSMPASQPSLEATPPGLTPSS